MKGFVKPGLVAAGVILLLVKATFAADTSKTNKMTLTGKAFEYRVSGYHLCVAFTGEDSLRWVYLAAPGDETGKTASETFDRRDIRSEVLMLSWTEKSGANVTDVFDFGEMALHASFVTADGKRFMSDAEIKTRTNCD